MQHKINIIALFVLVTGFLSTVYTAAGDNTSFEAHTNGAYSYLPVVAASPGDMIAVLAAMDEEHFFLYALREGTPGAQRLTDIEAEQSTIRWSPDGSMLGFLGIDPPGLWLVGAHGANPRLLVEGAHGFDWSPDGKRLVYHDGSGDIYTIDRSGSDKKMLTGEPNGDIGPQWSPDGDMIAFMRGSVAPHWLQYDLAVMQADGSNLQTFGDPSTDEYLKDWSPDGRSILYVRDDGEENVFTINADGTNNKQLTHFSNTLIWAAQFSPDGRTILVLILKHYGPYHADSELFTMNSDGSEQRSLLLTSWEEGGLLTFPDWSPDGARIALVVAEAEVDNVAVINADGSGLRYLTNNAQDYDGQAWFSSLAWRPTRTGAKR